MKPWNVEAYSGLDPNDEGIDEIYQMSPEEILQKAKDETVAKPAFELERIARLHKNRLLLGEQRLCSKLGIKAGQHLCYVRNYVSSGRVSAHWEAHARSQKDVEMWWRKAPPNDVKKRGRLDRYFSGQSEYDEPKGENTNSVIN